MSGDGTMDLADAILALQLLSGLGPAGLTSFNSADVNADSKISLPEVIYIMQKAAEMR